MVILMLVFKSRKNEDNYMKCKYCNKEIPDISVFCTFCGKSVAIDNTDQNRELQNGSRQSSDTNIPKKKNKRNLFIPIIIVSIIIAGLLSFGTLLPKFRLFLS